MYDVLDSLEFKTSKFILETNKLWVPGLSHYCYAMKYQQRMNGKGLEGIVLVNSKGLL